jgi:hypothetical protein
MSNESDDVNRLADDHLPVKVRALGLDPADRDGLVAAWQSLDESQLDQLARMEHERWAAPLWMAGWKSGPRDDSRRIHNNLVPYDELDQGTKNYDIEQVKAVPRYLGLVW